MSKESRQRIKTQNQIDKFNSIFSMMTREEKLHHMKLGVKGLNDKGSIDKMREYELEMINKYRIIQ